MKIQVNKHAPACHDEEIIIDAPAEKVYHILSDITNWPNWQSKVSETRLYGQIAPGTRFDWKTGGFRIKSEIHTATSPFELGWTGKMLWIKAIHNWTFHPEGKSTRVAVQESLEGFLAGMIQKTLVKEIKNNLLGLKVEAEQKAK